MFIRETVSPTAHTPDPSDAITNSNFMRSICASLGHAVAGFESNGGNFAFTSISFFCSGQEGRVWVWSEFFAGTAVGMIGLAALIAVEYIAPIERYTLKQRVPGIVMQYFGGWVGLALIWPIQQLWYAIGVHHYIIPLWSWLRPLGLFGFALQILVILAAWDFVRYWRHRAEHRWFWPIHAVHHSPTELHAANDIGHPLQGFIELAFVTVPMSFIQFSGPVTPFVVGMISSMLTVYIHSPTTAHLGPLWRVVVDPRFHRIHHSLEERHFNKNFAVCFSLWDTLFGTAYWPEPGEWPATGVKEYPAPRSFREFLLLPFSALKLNDDKEGEKVNGAIRALER